MEFSGGCSREEMQKDHDEKFSFLGAGFKIISKFIVSARSVVALMGRVSWLRVLILRFCAAVPGSGTLGAKKTLPKIRIWTTPL